MKKIIAVMALAVAGMSTVNAGVRFGFSFGTPVPLPLVTAPVPVVTRPPTVFVQPPMPAPIVEVSTACPTPGYVWVEGNWAWCDNHWTWTRGHWGPSAHFDRDVRWHQEYRAERHDGFHGRFNGRQDHDHR